MNFISIINQMSILFLLLLAGFAVKYLKIINDETVKGLSSLLLKVTMPALVISSMIRTYSTEVLINSGFTLLLSGLIYLAGIILSFILPSLFRVEKKNLGITRYMLLFANVGFVGFPVLEAIIGKESVFYGAIYNLPFNLLVFTIGIYLITNDGDAKVHFTPKMLLNPGLTCVFIGMFIFVFGIPIPYPIHMTIQAIGDLTTPLSMIIVGALMTNVSIKSLFMTKRLYFVCFFRLIAFPVLVWLVLRLWIHDPIMLGVPVILSGMPVGTTIAIMAEEYGADAEQASQSIFLSNLLSFITIPFLAYLLNI